MKISEKEWNSIDKYNHATKWVKPFCSYSLKLESGGRYKRKQYVNLFFYLLSFIPVCLIQLIYYMWDGGLKNFTWPERYLGGECFTPNSEPGKIAKEIMEGRNK